jgi:hypothetical protein
MTEILNKEKNLQRKLILKTLPIYTHKHTAVGVTYTWPAREQARRSSGMDGEDGLQIPAPEIVVADIAQGSITCLICIRPWAPSLTLQMKIKIHNDL